MDRMLREIERRLERFSDPDRVLILDVVREELSRERRRQDPPRTAESERERRLEAQTLREILEAITRQARLEDTISEVLKQLSRLVVIDSCALALAEADGSFRVFAVRGFPEPAKVIGQIFRNPLTDAIRTHHWPLSIADVSLEPRFCALEGGGAVRSWAGLPLLVEGEMIGLLCLERHRVESFDEEELHRAKAVAFSAAAAIRKAQLLDKVQRYARLMEQLVSVDQAVFAGRAPNQVARAILEGALKVGSYTAGLMALDYPEGPRVVASVGAALQGAEGRPAPPPLCVRTPTRFGAADLAPILDPLGVPPPRQGMFAIPFETADAYMGALALLDPDGETPDDRLMESYASRAAAALLHTLRRG